LFDSDRSTDYFREAVNYNFNEYLDISEVRSLKKFTLDKKAGEYLRTLPDEIKRRAFSQFDLFFARAKNGLLLFLKVIFKMIRKNYST